MHRPCTVKIFCCTEYVCPESDRALADTARARPVSLVLPQHRRCTLWNPTQAYTQRQYWTRTQMLLMNQTLTPFSLPQCPAPRLRVNEPSGLPSDRAYLYGRQDVGGQGNTIRNAQRTMPYTKKTLSSTKSQQNFFVPSHPCTNTELAK